MNTNANSLTTNNWLVQAAEKLKQAGVATARLDCLVLLQDALKADKSYILAHPEAKLSGAALRRLNNQLQRRKNHEPLAYIRGKSEFYGREFLVNKHTLEPRPETETMIDMFKNHVSPLIQVGPVCVVDVGTGSGCIGITISLEYPDIKVTATDISDKCLEISRRNAKKLGANVSFVKGSLLQPFQASESNLQDSVLLCNLPYVPDGHTINQAAMQEPKLAIFGGSDGLDLYRQLFEQIDNITLKPAHVLTECMPFQHKTLEKLANKAGYKLTATADFIQVFEFIGLG